MSKQTISTILLVDDNPFDIKNISQAMQNHKFNLIYAIDGKQAFGQISTSKPDLIILEAILSDISGYDVCKQIKAKTDYKDIPIIFLTSKCETDDIVKGFEAGCVDYITKPFIIDELICRVNSHLKTKDFINTLADTINILQETNKVLALKNSQLEVIMNKFRVASTTDYLTGIYNKRYAFETFKEHVADESNIKPFTIAIADIDTFKKINDTYGHICGDYVLKSVVNTMRSSLREEDLFSRWGGEEFLFLLPYTSIIEAKVFAEKMRKLIKDTVFHCDGNEFSVTITFGIAAYDKELGIEGTIKKADKALYEGKRNGRDCVVAY